MKSALDMNGCNKKSAFVCEGDYCIKLTRIMKFAKLHDCVSKNSRQPTYWYFAR